MRRLKKRTLSPLSLKYRKHPIMYPVSATLGATGNAHNTTFHPVHSVPPTSRPYCVPAESPLLRRTVLHGNWSASSSHSGRQRRYFSRLMSISGLLWQRTYPSTRNKGAYEINLRRVSRHPLTSYVCVSLTSMPSKHTEQIRKQPILFPQWEYFFKQTWYPPRKALRHQHR